MLALLLIAQLQPLPAELQTVSLRITQIQNSHSRGSAVYVVMWDRFDAEQPARVKTYRHRGKGSAVQGEHMKKIAEQLARDGQCVFVLSDAPAGLDLRAVLAQAGVKYMPLVAAR